MSPNILVTGAAGYIGGSILADFLARSDSLIEKNNISAAVRSEEQANILSKLGINVLKLDLTDEKAVVEGLLSNNIAIVIHCASSLDQAQALHLITALGKQQEATGEKTYFIHTSGLSAFMEKTGWPPGETKDTGPVFSVEKELADSFAIRKTDVAVIEHSKAQGVTSFIVIPCTVYGRGTGEWNQLSVQIPIWIQGSISQKAVYKFPEDTKVSGVNISDLTALYGQIVKKIVQKETISSGEEGYYFALAHEIVWSEALQHLAIALKARGLVTDSKIQIWTSDEAAAESLGVPAPFVQILFNAGENIVAENAHKIGWKPVWTYERFLQNIGDQIQDVVDLGKAKSSLVDSLFAAVRG